MTLRERIVETAEELFASKGFQHTTIADIIETAGVSKGGFYHHFGCKDEILEELIMAFISQAKSEYQRILDDTDQNVIDKFIDSYFEIGEHKKNAIRDSERIQHTFSYEGNHHLYQKMGEAFEDATTCFFSELFKQGIEEGIFHTAFPEELASMWSREVIRFYRISRKIISGRIADEVLFERTLRFNEQLINRQLNLPEKEIPLEAMGRKYLASMKRAVAERDGRHD